MDTSIDTTFLKDHFLIAMPGLNNSMFAHSITYLCEHNEAGAMGIIINQALDLSIDDIFQHLKITDITTPQPERVMAGGPVETGRGFILHKSAQQNLPRWQSSLQITPELQLTSSMDILQAIARGDGPQHKLVALGYAGWGEGQLESEIADNAWLTIPADSNIIFNTPCELRLQAATAQLGIDLSLIAPNAGHA